jgi:Fur family ferric uptake transcriptional regulator
MRRGRGSGDGLPGADAVRSAGLVTRHNFEGGHSVFELDHGEHHDHMVCTDTGEVIEFTDPVIEERQREIAEEHGFELVDHSLVLYVRKR